MSNPIHVRRCHVCGEVTEKAEQDVQRCDGCGKALLPFFYVDKRRVPVHSDENPLVQEAQILGSPLPLKAAYGPIWGLTALW